MRHRYFDMAKAIGIVLIIAAHTLYKKPDGISPFAFSFHVPIFFLISGYFFRPIDDTKSFLKKVTRGYIVPYVTTCAIMVVLAVGTALSNGDVWIPILTKWLSASFFGSGGRKDWDYWPVSVEYIGVFGFYWLFFGRAFLCI